MSYFDGFREVRSLDQIAGDQMPFSLVLELLREFPDARFARAGWNGKGMWIAYMKKYQFHTHVGHAGGFALALEPFLVMHAADKSLVVWSASQTDILATDWVLVPIEEAW